MKLIDRGLVFDGSRSDPSEGCGAFVSLIKLQDGSLLCSFKCGRQKQAGPQDKIVIMKSTDDGQTWNRLYDGFGLAYEDTPGSYSGGYLHERAPGELLISLHWIDRTDPTRPLSNPQTAGVLPMKYLLAESGDAGVSWSTPHEIDLSPHRGANPTGEILRLDNGQLMLSYESWKEWDEVNGEQSANVKFSSDEGATWSEPITMASDPDQRLYYWDNRVTRHPESGQTVALCWTHDSTQGRDVPIHMVWGDPDGTHWAPPKSTGISGQVAAPLFLDARRVLCVYVHRHDPSSIRIVQSEDAGVSWRLDDAMVIYDGQDQVQAGMERSRSEAEYWADMTRWTFGHPKAVRLSDNRVLVAYYAGTPEAVSIHWTLVEA